MSYAHDHKCPCCGGAWLGFDFTPRRDGKFDLFVRCRNCLKISPKWALTATELGLHLAAEKTAADMLMKEWHESESANSVEGK